MFNTITIVSYCLNHLSQAPVLRSVRVCCKVKINRFIYRLHAESHFLDCWGCQRCDRWRQIRRLCRCQISLEPDRRTRFDRRSRLWWTVARTYRRTTSCATGSRSRREDASARNVRTALCGLWPPAVCWSRRRSGRSAGFRRRTNWAAEPGTSWAPEDVSRQPRARYTVQCK